MPAVDEDKVRRKVKFACLVSPLLIDKLQR